MRLSVELVPTTCWYSNVRSNVRPETWDRLQRVTFQRARHLCEICGGRGASHPVEAHETWVYDDRLRIQRLDGLISLCPRCHEVKHIGLAIERGRGANALAWLAAVNDIGPEEALGYVQRAFAVHEIRSRFSWQIDIRVLVTHYRVAIGADGLEVGLNTRLGR